LNAGGSTNRGRKRNHRNYGHPFCSKIVIISGKTGNDAQKYQIKQVKEAVDEVNANEKGF